MKQNYYVKCRNQTDQTFRICPSPQETAKINWNIHQSWWFHQVLWNLVEASKILKDSTRFCKILQDSARFNVQEILMPKWCNTFVRQSLWPASNCCFRYRPWAKVEEGGIGLLRCLAPPESSAPGTHHALHCSGSCCRWCHRAVRCQVLGGRVCRRRCAAAVPPPMWLWQQLIQSRVEEMCLWNFSLS